MAVTKTFMSKIIDVCECLCSRNVVNGATNQTTFTRSAIVYHKTRSLWLMSITKRSRVTNTLESTSVNIVIVTFLPTKFALLKVSSFWSIAVPKMLAKSFLTSL